MSELSQPDVSDEPEVLRGLTEPQKERLTEVLDEYLRNMELGTLTDRSDLLTANPDIREALEAYLTKLDELNRLVGGEPRTSEIIGKQLGDFRLIRELGRGGMGIVYLAQQISLDRLVAVKLLPFASLLETKYIERFKNEARAAAQLEHPNIVPVYSIGQDDGIHYYAMRYIEGQSLDQVIATARLQREPAAAGRTIAKNDWTTLLQQFAEVAEALHRAHEYGVVHRDIKPSNLLLDLNQKLWLADFGLARFQTDSPLTRTGEMIGTMRYMSPEQAAGRSELIDHRTDIYSLGATLYEALTYEPAVVGNEGPALLRVIEQDSPVRLRKLCPGLPSDIQTLLEKSMAKHRDDRYATADLLAQDLRRASSGFPILASRLTPWLRAWRWSEKHRAVLASAAGVVAVAMLGLSISVVLINRARKTAEDNLKSSQTSYRESLGVLGELSELGDELAGIPGAEPARQRLLSDIESFYQRFSKRTAGESIFQTELAQVYSRIGKLNEQLQSAEAALEYYELAQKQFESLEPRNAKNPEVLRQQAANFNALGLAYAKLGRREDADAAYQSALAIQEEFYSEQATREQQIDLALTRSNYGLLMLQEGKTAQAESAFTQVIEQLKEAVNANDKDFRAMRGLGAARSNLGAIQMERDPREAMRTISDALDVQLELTNHSSHYLQATVDVVASYSILGEAALRAEDWQAAVEANDKAIALSHQLVTIAPKVSMYQQDLAACLNNRGLALLGQNKLRAARDAFRESIDRQAEKFKETPANALLASNLGSAWNNLGKVLELENDRTRATAAYQQAITMQRRALESVPLEPSYRENLGKTLANLSHFLRQLNDVDGEAATLRDRRELWKQDASKLSSVAEDFASLVNRSPDLFNELFQTVELCRSAGVKSDDLLRRPAFTDLPASIRERLR